MSVEYLNLDIYTFYDSATSFLGIQSIEMCMLELERWLSCEEHGLLFCKNQVRIQAPPLRWHLGCGASTMCLCPFAICLFIMVASGQILSKTMASQQREGESRRQLCSLVVHHYEDLESAVRLEDFGGVGG